MIGNIRHRGLRLLYERGDRSGIRQDVVQRVERLLSFLDQAEEPQDMNVPGCGLHSLTGDLRGYWSVKVSRNYRIIFRFGGQDVVDVDLVDYH
jgi:proteic killer suppression protein